jgi:hypothetical protein
MRREVTNLAGKLERLRLADESEIARQIVAELARISGGQGPLPTPEQAARINEEVRREWSRILGRPVSWEELGIAPPDEED